tara:strand:+ start:805 stop:939 length:135 start_codon:yes stop_codon:yes gene_type:complete
MSGLNDMHQLRLKALRLKRILATSAHFYSDQHRNKDKRISGKAG